MYVFLALALGPGASTAEVIFMVVAGLGWASMVWAFGAIVLPSIGRKPIAAVVAMVPALGLALIPPWAWRSADQWRPSFERADDG